MWTESHSSTVFVASAAARRTSVFRFSSNSRFNLSRPNGSHLLALSRRPPRHAPADEAAPRARAIARSPPAGSTWPSGRVRASSRLDLSGLWVADVGDRRYLRPRDALRFTVVERESTCQSLSPLESSRRASVAASTRASLRSSGACSPTKVGSARSSDRASPLRRDDGHARSLFQRTARAFQ